MRTIKTQVEVRKAFWEAHPQFLRQGRLKQNDYPTDTRCAFVDFVDVLARDGQISEKLASKVTL